MVQRLFANMGYGALGAPSAQQRSIIVTVLVSGIIIVAVLFLPFAYLFQPYPFASRVVEAIAITTFVTILLLVRRGYLAQGVVLFLTVVILGPFAAMVGARCISSVPIFMLFSVLIASLLVRPIQIWLVLLIDLLGLYLVVFYLSSTGYLLDDYDFMIVAMMPVVLVMTALIGYLGASTIEAERAALQHALAEQRLVEQDLLQAKHAAEAANRAKSSFLANMNHELRTPLTAILGYTNLLLWQANARGDEEYTTDLVVIECAGQHLLSLINNLLDMSKIDAGKFELSRETFAIAPMLAELGESFRPLIGRNRNELVIDCDPAIGAMYADPTKMRQVLINLLSNASKYTEQGTITLRAQRADADDGEWVLFAVADTGMGIAPEALPQLFQSFKRALDPPQASKYGGAGLGLALSQHICQTMGGEISVESAPGAGSTFVIRLPRQVLIPDAQEISEFAP